MVRRGMCVGRYLDSGGERKGSVTHCGCAGISSCREAGDAHFQAMTLARYIHVACGRLVPNMANVGTVGRRGGGAGQRYVADTSDGTQRTHTLGGDKGARHYPIWNDSPTRWADGFHIRARPHAPSSCAREYLCSSMISSHEVGRRLSELASGLVLCIGVLSFSVVVSVTWRECASCDRRVGRPMGAPRLICTDSPG